MAIVALVVFTALAEVVSLGAVLPFLGVLTGPERVIRHPVVGRLMRLVGATSASQLVSWCLAVAFAAAAIVAGALRMLLLWVSTRVAYATGADFSSEVYRRTLYQPYHVQITRNSSEVISGITGKVADTVTVLNQLLILLSSSVLSGLHHERSFAIDPVVAVLAMLGFGGGYAVITAMSAADGCASIASASPANIPRWSKRCRRDLGGIRDVLLDGTQPVYCDIYRRADHGMRRAYGNIIFASRQPALCDGGARHGADRRAGVRHQPARRGGGERVAGPRCTGSRRATAAAGVAAGAIARGHDRRVTRCRWRRLGSAGAAAAAGGVTARAVTAPVQGERSFIGVSLSLFQ